MYTDPIPFPDDESYHHIVGFNSRSKSKHTLLYGPEYKEKNLEHASFHSHFLMFSAKSFVLREEMLHLSSIVSLVKDRAVELVVFFTASVCLCFLLVFQVLNIMLLHMLQEQPAHQFYLHSRMV